MADIFLVQDEIVSKIVAKISGNYGVIDITEARSATRKNLINSRHTTSFCARKM